jgi:hypothetical protein
VEQNRSKVDELSRLLQAAAKKHNESADAACRVAGFFDSSHDELADKTLDTIFDTVAGLAGASLNGKPDYRRAARTLMAKARRRAADA